LKNLISKQKGTFYYSKILNITRYCGFAWYANPVCGTRISNGLFGCEPRI